MHQRDALDGQRPAERWARVESLHRHSGRYDGRRTTANGFVMSDGLVSFSNSTTVLPFTTGAGSGMGRAHAHLPASRGAVVVVVDELERTIDRAHGRP
jgi:hypothetical protein